MGKPLNPKEKREVKRIIKRLERLKKKKTGGNTLGLLALGTAVMTLQKMLPKKDRLRRLK